MAALDTFTLKGKHIRLEPLEMRHAAGLVAATAQDRELYKWTLVPFTEAAAREYVQMALDGRAAGYTHAFAVVRLSDGAVIGSTRFYDIGHWAWPVGSPFAGHAVDVSEIGWTWLAPSAVRTVANTEQKLLMLTHAFEVWNSLRVFFHTDARNERSANALARIGAKFEGTLRAHKIAADGGVRDSVRFSIVADEWPDVKSGLERSLRSR